MYNSRDLDNHITGHYGEDYFADDDLDFEPWDDTNGEEDDEADDEFPAGASITVAGYGGVAWRVECVRHSRRSVDRVRAHMVGDDRTWEFDREECTVIDEDDFCHECGQIGCTADGRMRDEDY